MGKIKRIRWILILVAITAISWDIAVSKLDVEEGTFRFESEFDAVSGATAKVGIVTSDYVELSDPVERIVNPSYNQIEEMVGKAIELQGGFEWVIDKGDKVMLKVNLVGANSPSGQGENTDVRVVKAIIKHIAAYTENDVEIVVAEGTARTNDDPTESGSVWENSGYTPLLTDTSLSGINLRLLNLNQSVDDLIEVDLENDATAALQGTKYMVHREEIEADVYIAVPVLKIHDTGITNALKLQIGSAPGCYYGYNKRSGTELSTGIYHIVGQRVWTTEAIVDLCNVADIDFVVVDAIMCLQSQKSYNGSNQLRYNTILAGADPVAVDHASAKLMGINPDDVAHITLAEKVGLGTNNPDYIEIVGVAVNDAMIRAKKDTRKVDGKYGQSNRTWILSQAFEGTNIDKEYFVDEANIQPLPGDNGWTEPVYFFDDRIDLFSFYEGATNIVTYAFTYFDAPKDEEVELWLGTHEAMMVNINGEEVYKFTSTASYSDNERGEKKKTINIKKGKNTLFVKTLNKFGDFTFALNICEVESDINFAGNRVDGLKFYIDESGTSTELDTSTVSVFDKSNGAMSVKCFPNPATEYSIIGFELQQPSKVTLNIYNSSGQLVKTIDRRMLTAGKHEFTWYIDTNEGVRAECGVYFCTLSINNQKISTKLIVE